MQKTNTVLVTGGAGYIGSHIVLALLDNGYQVVVIDDLSNGFKELVVDSVPLIQHDFADQAALNKIFSQFNIDTVIHAAARTSVPESTEHPSLYYQNNVISSFHLICNCIQHNIKTFIFSSSSAVYGKADTAINEAHKLAPISPYGLSKLMTEQMLHDIAKENGIASISLRYFNVVGADPHLRAGDMKESSGSLINRILQCISGDINSVNIFGNDYVTNDGTAVRDYIHVSDIAQAHVCAIKYAQRYNNHSVFNLGLGKGHSVQEIITKVAQLSGVTIQIQHQARRAGDPIYVVADMQRTQKDLGFSPQYDLDKIITDALAWKKHNTFLPKSIKL